MTLPAIVNLRQPQAFTHTAWCSLSRLSLLKAMLSSVDTMALFTHIISPRQTHIHLPLSTATTARCYETTEVATNHYFVIVVGLIL